MTIEAAERYLSMDRSVTQAFQKVNERYADHLGNEAYLQKLLDTQSLGLFVDYLHAGLGWLANRAVSPFLNHTGEQGWQMIDEGPRAVITALNNNLLETVVLVTGVKIDPPPFFVEEGLVSTRSPSDGQIYFVVPVHFFLHAQQYPVEAMAHLASGATQMRDLEQVGLTTIRGPDHLAAIAKEMSRRSLAATTQVFIEAGNSYKPSSPIYDHLRQMGRKIFPNGTSGIPLDLRL